MKTIIVEQKIFRELIIIEPYICKSMVAKLSTSLNYIDNTPENDRHKNHMALIRLIEQVEKAENNGVPLFVGVI
jgi:hypothetical protein